MSASDSPVPSSSKKRTGADTIETDESGINLNSHAFQSPVASSSKKRKITNNKNVNADNEILDIVKAMNDRDDKQSQEQNKMDQEYLQVFRGIGEMFAQFLTNRNQNN